ncbi:MAG: LysR family transcriptional regulator, partial [Pseudomonadota bacterium]
MDRFNFTLKQLRYVEAAGRLGSIASAAGELNISQSSITSAIDALETEVGFDLFIRTRAKGLKTTSSGDQIIQMISNFI